MKRALLPVLFVLYAVAAHASIIYVTDLAGNLATVDPLAGNTTRLGNLPVPMADIAYNTSDKSLYGISWETPSRLFRINPLDPGAATPILTMPVFLNALDVAGPSVALAAGGNSIYFINVAAKVATLWKTIPARFGDAAGDITRNPVNPGEFLMSVTGKNSSGASSLVAVDYATAAMRMLGPIGANDVFGLVTTAEGVVYGFSNADRSESIIDPVSGAGRRTASVGPDLSGASGAAIDTPFAGPPIPDFSSSVPEPGSVWLGISGVILLAVARARRCLRTAGAT